LQIEPLQSLKEIQETNDSAFQWFKLPTAVGELNNLAFQFVERLKKKKRTSNSLNRNGAPSRAH
jgi:hypothetical protein